MKKSEKDKYELWNENKQNLNTRNIPDFYINIREIWYIKMGKNIGFEEDGKEKFLRPALVLKKVGNLFFTVALTSKGKNKHYFYHKFDTVALHQDHLKHKDNSYAILSQVKVMDKRRFIENIGYLPEKEFNIIKKKIKNILF